jgi:chromosome segregation ATPase
MNIPTWVFELITAVGTLAWTIAIFVDLRHYKNKESYNNGMREQRLITLEQQMENFRESCKDAEADHNDNEKALIEQRKDIESLNEKVDGLSEVMKILVDKVEVLTIAIEKLRKGDSNGS